MLCDKNGLGLLQMVYNAHIFQYVCFIKRTEGTTGDGGSFGDNHEQRRQQDEWITWYETVRMGGKYLRTDCSNADWSWSEKKQLRYFARLNGEAHSTSRTEHPPVSCPLFDTLSLLTIKTFFPRTTLGLIKSSLWNHFKMEKQSVSASYDNPAHQNRPQVHVWHTSTPTMSGT